MKKTRVVIGIPCLMLGGSELATLSLARALVGGGYDVTVCCYYEHDAAMVERFEKAGARVELLGLSRGSLRHLFSTLVTYFRSQQPDVVHVQYFAPGMVPILAARRAGVQRIFATVHAAGQKGYGWKAKAMLRFAARFTDHFFCVSQNAEQFWFGSTSPVGERTAWSRIRHSTIYNGVDVQRTQAAGLNAERGRLCPEIPAEARVIGIVGRLVRLKGHLTLLQAMRTIVRQAPETFLLVIGTGPDEALFQQEAKTLGIERHVIWKGRIEPEALPQYYHIMDVLAMPSHWEGFGLTAAEAMAAGKPVVGTDVPGLREVLEEGATGFLVPVGEAEALADKLLALLRDPQRAAEMGRSGHFRARELFDGARCSEKWLTTYQSLLAAGVA
ncbi:MAG: glycosyltransferase family 4 protein [Planctomycetota bacterium]|jgi:glycosyltransferase involved in cell wall biosynthesis|nr:glycosyltransferase family 4 protein [Planctomycetota bacterium]